MRISTESPTEPMLRPADQDRPEFRILVICTGNLFRSPLAAGLLQQGFDEVAPGRFLVDSAGTAGVSAEPVTHEVKSLAAEWGFDLSGFRARRLQSTDIIESDLIIGMERWHRSQAVILEPSALKRSFTLREFARIIRPLPAAVGLTSRRRWTQLVSQAQRSRMPHADRPECDDVVDPHQDWSRLCETMIEQMVPGVFDIVDWEYRSTVCSPYS
ncbi:low molecular weight phosphatase family protein [Brevibacterium renqingii]|uniref:arsenate-mycothiol transferase ArsC n=1 Tax=Brevibacterium renqingii TaxID=2776916 RepID=UPI001AE084AB